MKTITTAQPAACIPNASLMSFVSDPEVDEGLLHTLRRPFRLGSYCVATDGRLIVRTLSPEVMPEPYVHEDAKREWRFLKDLLALGWDDSCEGWFTILVDPLVVPPREDGLRLVAIGHPADSARRVFDGTRLAKVLALDPAAQWSISRCGMDEMVRVRGTCHGAAFDGLLMNLRYGLARSTLLTCAPAACETATPSQPPLPQSEILNLES